MKVKALVAGLSVDGVAHAKGAEFEMTNPRAAHDAAERGEVKIVDGEPEPMAMLPKSPRK